MEPCCAEGRRLRAAYSAAYATAKTAPRAAKATARAAASDAYVVSQEHRRTHGDDA